MEVHWSYMVCHDFALWPHSQRWTEATSLATSHTTSQWEAFQQDVSFLQKVDNSQTEAQYTRATRMMKGEEARMREGEGQTAEFSNHAFKLWYRKTCNAI